MKKHMTPEEEKPKIFDIFQDQFQRIKEENEFLREQLKEERANGERLRRYNSDALAKIKEIANKLDQKEEEIAKLEYWKKSEIEIWLPIIEYMQKHKELKVGDSISERVLEFLKARDELLGAKNGTAKLGG